MKETKVKKWLLPFFVVSLVIVLALFLYWDRRESSEGVTIRFGITPYQDTALPVVAAAQGWFEEKGLDIEFVPLTWGDVMLGLSSGAIDVSIYTINSFQTPYESAVEGPRQPLFLAPIYVFKGTAIMVHGDSGIEPVGDLLAVPEGEREEKVRLAAEQLRGKRVAVTEGTEFEQIVLAALEKAGLDKGVDVDVFHASVEDALAGFLSRDIDAFGAGLTERIEARRRGAVELLVASDVGPPSIDGLVTTVQFAQENSEALDALLEIWFRTIRFMETDVKENSRFVRDYLEGKASTRYSPEEYEIAWSFNVFPSSVEEAIKVFQNENSPYFWRNVWDYNNEFLREQGKIKVDVPYEAYSGEEVLQRLSSGSGQNSVR